MSDNGGLLFGLVCGFIAGVLLGAVWGGSKILGDAQTAATQQLCAPKCPEGFTPQSRLGDVEFTCLCRKDIEVK